MGMQSAASWKLAQPASGFMVASARTSSPCHRGADDSAASSYPIPAWWPSRMGDLQRVGRSRLGVWQNSMSLDRCPTLIAVGHPWTHEERQRLGLRCLQRGTRRRAIEDVTCIGGAPGRGCCCKSRRQITAKPPIDVTGLFVVSRAGWCSWLSAAGVGGCRPSVCGGVDWPGCGTRTRCGLRVWRGGCSPRIGRWSSSW